MRQLSWPVFAELGAKQFLADEAEAEFLQVLQGVTDPEAKRSAIGEQFVKVQERILATKDFLDGHWILGQGTIYPDTIESGGTAKADLIKTHHNRVAGIQALINNRATPQIYKADSYGAIADGCS